MESELPAQISLFYYTCGCIIVLGLKKKKKKAKEVSKTRRYQKVCMLSSFPSICYFVLLCLLLFCFLCVFCDFRIIIRMIIALKGAIQDFSSTTVSNTYSQVARAQSCANQVQHTEAYHV